MTAPSWPYAYGMDTWADDDTEEPEPDPPEVEADDERGDEAELLREYQRDCMREIAREESGRR